MIYKLPSLLFGIIWILFSNTAFYKSIAEEDEKWLDLTTVNTVRVDVLSGKLANSFFVESRNTSLFIITGDKTHEINNQLKPVQIRRDRNSIKILSQNESITVKEFFIQSSQGYVSILDSRTGKKSYDGILHVSAGKIPGEFTLVNHVELEKYVASVVNSEMNFKNPEALKAQAVVSRTYALWSMKENRNSKYDLTDNEMHQVYLGRIPGNSVYVQAANETKSEILTWNDKLILAAYSSTCGGVTNPNEAVWKGKSKPYLRSVNDRKSCSISPHFNWDYQIDKSQLFEKVKMEFKFEPVKLFVTSEEHNRVTSVTFIAASGNTMELTGNDFRLFFKNYFGSYSIKSSRFILEETGNAYSFKGSGMGHGVGLCQYGALGLAQTGWEYNKILLFYFNSVKVVDYSNIKNKRIALAL